MVAILISLLGPPELALDGRSVRIERPRECVVLCALAISVNRVTSVEDLVDAVWGDAPPETARSQIHICVSRLRRLLGPELHRAEIETRAPGYLLKIDRENLDTARFAAVAAAGRRSARAGERAQAVALLREALALWRGNAFSGVRSELVRREATVLDQERLDVLELLMRLEVELGQHELVTSELAALVEGHPLREPFAELLMLALYRGGRQAEALEVARRTRARLVEDLGIEPGPSLQRLSSAILNQDPELDLPPQTARPGTAEPTSDRVGEPALPPTVPRQLPRTIADFTGRAEQIARVSNLLLGVDSEGSLAATVVAVAGKGGVGKSTLATRVAHEVSSAFPDGQLYADLHGPEEGISSAALSARFLRALGVTGAAVPADLEERLDLYRTRLAGKRILVVLDGVEDDDLARDLLPASPGSGAILTGRTRLATLPGVNLVHLEEFSAQDSTTLLSKILGPDRVAAEPEATRALVEVCSGLPLAVRIAGSRLASRPQWTMATLVHRLADHVHALNEFSHRGLALRANLALSHRALSDPAKELFALCSLMETPEFPSWAAAALVDASLVDAEDTLEDLVDAQLLDTRQQPGGPVLYRMHDLVRLYAREQAETSVGEPARQDALVRLLGAWLAFAEASYQAAYGGDFETVHGAAPRWYPELPSPAPTLRPIVSEVERESLVVAVRQAVAADLDELAWDLALTAVHLFEVRGNYDDWRDTTVRALECCERAGNRTGRAAMLFSLGAVVSAQRRLEEGEVCFAEALSEFRALGNDHAIALVLRNWAMIDRFKGRYSAAQDKYAEALVKMRAAKDAPGEAHVLRSLALLAMNEGSVGPARDLIEEALRLSSSVGHRRGQAMVLARLAELNLRANELSEAEENLDRALLIVRELGDRTGECHVLFYRGLLHHRQDHADQARASLRNALLLADDVGERVISARTEHELGLIAAEQGDLGIGARHLETALEIFTAMGLPPWRVTTLRSLAELRHRLGEEDLARAALSEASLIDFDGVLPA